MSQVLDRVNSPGDVKALKQGELERLCSEIRELLSTPHWWSMLTFCSKSVNKKLPLSNLALLILKDFFQRHTK